MERGLGLRHAAAAHVGEQRRQQQAGDHADLRRDEKQPHARWRQAEEEVIDSLD